MLMKKTRFLFVAASVISVLLFAGGNGMAATACGPDFSRFDLVTQSKQGVVTGVVASSYGIKFLGTTEVVISGVTYYKWRYQTQTSLGISTNMGVSNIQFLVPANNGCDLQNEYRSITGVAANLLPPGSSNSSNEGNPYWRLVYERQILKETSDDSSSQNTYGFLTKTLSQPKPMSVYIKSGNEEFVTQTLGPSFPVEKPAIETSCQQIRKNSNPKTCLHVCYETGGSQELVSADLYQNEDCSGDVYTPLKVFSPSDGDPSMLICNPCDITGAPACPTNTNVEVKPFTMVQGTGKVKCDIFRKEYETSGFTAEIGDDPCFMVNRRYTCY